MEENKLSKEGLLVTLAIERTFLAYTRTALTLIVAGITFVKFFETKSHVLAGFVFVAVGVILQTIGSIRFVVMKKKINGK